MVAMSNEKIGKEYLAAGIRQQIRSLSDVIDEMESDFLGPEALSWRLKAIELGLRRLRDAA